MNRFLILFFIISTGLRIYADPGDAYRYKATIIFSDSQNITGYFYFTTYDKGFDDRETDFTKYILSYYPFPIVIYENIKTVEINKDLTVDFTLAGSGIIINKDNIDSIILMDEIFTKVGSRLRELSPNQLKLLDHDFIDSESIYNESIAISCIYYFLNWDNGNDLGKLKEDIAKDLERFVDDNDMQSFQKYYEEQKQELVEKKIIFFNYCGPL